MGLFKKPVSLKIFANVFAMLFLLYFTTPFSTQAQFVPKDQQNSQATSKDSLLSYKWGKISEAEKQIETCSFDPNASALVLYEKGVLRITRLGGVQTKIHRRIKILNKNGKDQADVVIKLFAPIGFKPISGLRAQTINTDSSAKTTIYSVKADAIYKNRINDRYLEVRFTFPNADVGSIIEFSYTKHSENYLFPDGWYFQDQIPILRSDFKVITSKEFEYNVLYQGNNITSKYGSQFEGNLWVLENIPSFKEEAFVWNFQDYIDRIRLQLAGYVDTYGHFNSSIESWESIFVNYLENENVKEYQKKRGMFKKILSKINLDDLKGIKKAQAIYDYVRLHVLWNKSYGIIPSLNIKGVIDKIPSSGVDINLLLSGLLNAAGIKAYPAIISTKSNGKVFKGSPFLSQLNHVICLATVNKKEIFMDATDPLCPFYLLPVEDLNESAFVLNPKDLHWKEIKISNTNLQITSLNLILEENEAESLSSKGNLICDYIGYYGLKSRSDFKIQGEENFKMDFIKADQAEIQSLKIENLNDLEKNFRINFELEMSYPSAGDLVYLYPLIIKKFQNNPFNEKERNFPVDFGFPVADNYYINYQVPDNYEVVETPEAIRMKIPGNGGQFSYSVEMSDNRIQTRFQLKLLKSFFSVEEYHDLRELFTQFIAKIHAPLVLRKKP